MASTLLLSKLNLSLSECISLFKENKFALHEFLKVRGQTLLEAQHNGKSDFIALIGLLRGPFYDALRQALTIFPEPETEKEILQFAAHTMFSILSDLLVCLEDSQWDSNQLALAWSATRFASEAFRLVNGEFIDIFEKVFVERSFLSLIGQVEGQIEFLNLEAEINISESEEYEAEIGNALNALVDLINTYRLFPTSSMLKDRLAQFISQQEGLNSSAKKWALNQL